MKKQLSIITGIFLTSFCLTIVAEDAPFSTGPAPAQSYHSVSSNASNNNATSSVAYSASKAPVAPATVASIAPDNSNNPALSNKQIETATTQEQLTEAAQATAEYEQQTNARIQNLVDSNHAMGAAIQTLNEQMLQMQMQVKQLQATTGNVGAAHAIAAANSFHQLVQKDNTIYFDVAAAVIFMIALIVMTMRYFQQKPLSETIVSEKEIEKGDYDFMGTSEAIPAKLDLARSYITMGEYDAAKKILHSIMESDDKERSLEAKLLFDRIDVKTK